MLLEAHVNPVALRNDALLSETSQIQGSWPGKGYKQGVQEQKENAEIKSIASQVKKY